VGHWLVWVLWDVRAVWGYGVWGTVGCMHGMLWPVTGHARGMCGALHSVLQDLWGTGAVP